VRRQGRQANSMNQTVHVKMILLCMAVPSLSMISLLLASSSGILLPFGRNDFAQHDYAVAVHECDA